MIEDGQVIGGLGISGGT
ncbi:hypothetical protein [Streptomyces sp. uw30]